MSSMPNLGVFDHGHSSLNTLASPWHLIDLLLFIFSPLCSVKFSVHDHRWMTKHLFCKPFRLLSSPPTLVLTHFRRCRGVPMTFPMFLFECKTRTVFLDWEKKKAESFPEG
jgi:hypothetical protein